MSEFEWVDDSGISSIDVCKYMQFCGGNCFKYLYRAGQKGCAIEDLEKAVWYAERAGVMGDVVCGEAAENIEKIYLCRKGNILQAMRAIEVNLWLIAQNYIKEEIARLESVEGYK